MGMFNRVPVELHEADRPQFHADNAWGDVVTMTVAFGHGISVTPLHVVAGTAAVANGGVLMKPTILAEDPDNVPEGTRVMQHSTSDMMRRLMRLVVTSGFGKKAEVPGYYPGGKTGTAEKNSGHGYKKHANVSAFMSVFPMQAPRYAVYMMLDEPHGNASTGGYSTAGQVAAPAAGRVISRVGPILGLMPDIQDAAGDRGGARDPAAAGAGPATRPGTLRGAATGANGEYGGEHRGEYGARVGFRTKRCRGRAAARGTGSHSARPATSGSAAPDPDRPGRSGRAAAAQGPAFGPQDRGPFNGGFPCC